MASQCLCIPRQQLCIRASVERERDNLGVVHHEVAAVANPLVVGNALPGSVVHAVRLLQAAHMYTEARDEVAKPPTVIAVVCVNKGGTVSKADAVRHAAGFAATLDSNPGSIMKAWHC
jgi:hypothetical protein